MDQVDVGNPLAGIRRDPPNEVAQRGHRRKEPPDCASQNRSRTGNPKESWAKQQFAGHDAEQKGSGLMSLRLAYQAPLPPAGSLRSTSGTFGEPRVATGS